MRTITRSAAAAALCAPLLLGACTIGDPENDGDEATATPAAPATTTADETETETAAETETGEPEEPDATPVETDPDSPGAWGLAIGDCVADIDQLDSDEDIDVVDCAEPHAGEVFAQADIAGRTLFPGNERLGQEAGEICGGDAFTEYVGIAFGVSGLDVITMMPSMESWAQDDRTVTCVVTDPNLTQIDGTLEQSWR